MLIWMKTNQKNLLKNLLIVGKKFTQTWVALSDDDIDMLEQIDSAVNHITHDMIDDMVLGEIENLLIKYTEFMNKKIRD